MARSRQLKPGFFKNEHLVALPFSTRLLFAGLWTLADKAGRLEDRPLKIKMELFPADSIDIDAGLTELANAAEPFIRRYVAQGVALIEVVKWDQNQKPHHQEADSILPGSDEVGDAGGETSEPLRTLARTASDEGAKRSVKVTSNKVKVTSNKNEGEFQNESLLDPVPAGPLRDATTRWLAYKGERKERYQPTGLRSLLSRIVNLTEAHGEATVIAAMDRAMANGWKGFDHDVGAANAPRAGPTQSPKVWIPTSEIRTRAKP
jgi:hypothetical protein